MSTLAAAPRSSRLSLLAPALLPLICMVWAFWTTLAELAQVWSSNPQYSHGWLVPGFAALLLWLRRDRLQSETCRPSLWGFVILAAGLALRLVGTYRYYVWLEPISIVPCVAGLVVLVGGRGAWRWAWPAVLFLVFMVPLPYRAAVAMSGPLQRLATITSTFVMQTMGMPALDEGTIIQLNDHQIGVVEACSGLRMLVVFVALSTAVVLTIRSHWIDRVVILASSIPIALISNIMRVTATGVMYELGYSELASTFFHDVAGWLMMPLALGMLWVELKVLSWLFIDTPVSPLRGGTSVPRRPAGTRPAVPRGRRQAQPAATREREKTTQVEQEQVAEQTADQR